MSRSTLWGLGAALVGAGLAAFLMLRKPGADLDPTMLEAARARWTSTAIPAYRMTVRVAGRQTGDHEIEVRNGKVVHMTTGGQQVAAQARAYWSVSGMFEFLANELRNRSDPVLYGGAEVQLIAAFDPKLGYPHRFVRHVQGRNQGIEWEVTSFARLEATSNEQAPGNGD